VVWWTWAGMVRVLKPVAAGVALAYVVTGFLDGPSPVDFTPDGPRSAKQAEIVEPQAELVIERNVMKLGSLLTFKAEGSVREVRRAESADDDLDMFYDPGVDVPAVKGTVTDVPEAGQ